MTQIKEEGVDIPSLDDFTESSLLDQIQTKGEEETEEEIAAREAEEAAAKLKLEEEAETEEEKEIRLAKEQEDELTDEEKEELELKKKEKEGEGSFWEDVEAITGTTYEVDYGDVEPDSPEGAAIREEVVANKAVESNLAYLEEKFPDGFKALMHVSNGGQLKDLFNADTVDYKNLVIEDTNVDGQKGFMKNFYMEKGFSEAKAIRNVEDDEDSEEGLLENFKAALKEKQDKQETASKTVFEEQEKAKVAQDTQDKQFGETLSGIINKGQIGNFKIDKKDAEGFYNHVFSNIQRHGKGYALNLPITRDNFQSQLEQMFFGFKKGDLSKFVAAKAKTDNVRKLKRSLGKDKMEESSSEDGKRKRGAKLPTLGAFETE